MAGGLFWTKLPNTLLLSSAGGTSSFLLVSQLGRVGMGGMATATGVGGQVHVAAAVSGVRGAISAAEAWRPECGCSCGSKGGGLAKVVALAAAGAWLQWQLGLCRRVR